MLSLSLKNLIDNTDVNIKLMMRLISLTNDLSLCGLIEYAHALLEVLI